MIQLGKKENRARRRRGLCGHPSQKMNRLAALITPIWAKDRRFTTWLLQLRDEALQIGDHYEG